MGMLYVHEHIMAGNPKLIVMKPVVNNIDETKDGKERKRGRGFVYHPDPMLSTCQKERKITKL